MVGSCLYRGYVRRCYIFSFLKVLAIYHLRWFFSRRLVCVNVFFFRLYATIYFYLFDSIDIFLITKT